MINLEVSEANRVVVNTAEIVKVDQPDPDSTPGNASRFEDDQASVSLALGGPFDLAGTFLSTDNGGDVDLQFSCNPNGISTIELTATGRATGTFPGTFTESATISIGPQTLPPFPPGFVPSMEPRGEVVHFESTFTITGTEGGQVVGTKKLMGLGTSEFEGGICRSELRSFVFARLDNLHYDAAIEGLGDSGPSNNTEVGYGVGLFEYFQEQFAAE